MPKIKYNRIWINNQVCYMDRISLAALNIITNMLDPPSYLKLIRTCKKMHNLTTNEQFRANHAVDVAHILKLIFEDKRNVFITGSGGCGKTYLINKIYEMGINMSKSISMTATTGLASTNLTNGTTIHSFSGLRKGTTPVNELPAALRDGLIKPSKIKWNNDMLIIDEFSMNGSRLLEKLNIVGKHARDCASKPLGGIQLVMSGDFYQLPPVCDSFAFKSPVWDKIDPVIVTLKYPFRQSTDMKYYFMLQRIRVGEPTEEDYKWLENKYLATKALPNGFDDFEIKPTRIYAKNKQVHKINEYEFNLLDGPIEHESFAIDSIVRKVADPTARRKYRYSPAPDASIKEALEQLQDRIVPEVIRLKNKTQLIMTFNVNVAKQYVNGSRCVYQDGLLKFKNNEPLKTEYIIQEFCYYLGNNLYFIRKQLALKYGWAITCHASQGMSMDMAIVDLGDNIFSPGQAYVALSRVKNSDGLYIENFSKKSIRHSKAAKEFYN